MRNGLGVITWANGSKYIGGWFNLLKSSEILKGKKIKRMDKENFFTLMVIFMKVNG